MPPSRHLFLRMLNGVVPGTVPKAEKPTMTDATQVKSVCETGRMRALPPKVEAIRRLQQQRLWHPPVSGCKAPATRTSLQASGALTLPAACEVEGWGLWSPESPRPGVLRIPGMQIRIEKAHSSEAQASVSPASAVGCGLEPEMPLGAEADLT